MKALTCAAARRRAAGVSRRRAARSATRLPCQRARGVVQPLRRRAGGPATACGRCCGRRRLAGRPLPCDEAAAFTATVVSRVKAEHDASVRRAGCTTCSRTCAWSTRASARRWRRRCAWCIMLGMMRFATERASRIRWPAILNFLATPGTNENPFVVDARVVMPRALDAPFSSGELLLVAEDAAGGRPAPPATRWSTLLSHRDARRARSPTSRFSTAAMRRRGAPEATDARGRRASRRRVARPHSSRRRARDCPSRVNMVWLRRAHHACAGSTRRCAV